MIDIFRGLENLESKKFIHDQIVRQAKNEFDRELESFSTQLLAFIRAHKNDASCQKIANEIYWQSVISIGLATVVKKAWKLATGKSFYPDAYTTEFVCANCSENLCVTSVAAYQTLAKATYIHLCDRCRNERNQENSLTWQRELYELEQRKIDLHRMPYAEYLKTPEWKETRKKMLKRAGYRCQLCFSDGELHVHHRTYERRGYELLSDLIVLCRKHHEQFHEASNA